jgi:hypothetical protein
VVVVVVDFEDFIICSVIFGVPRIVVSLLASYSVAYASELSFWTFQYDASSFTFLSERKQLTNQPHFFVLMHIPIVLCAAMVTTGADIVAPFMVPN